MTMKALSLWQPWATAIARGSKRIETRRWATDYRGPLAIHAAKRMVKSEMLDFGCRWNWCGALGWVLGNHEWPWEILPFGAVVAVCELVACRPTESFTVGDLDVVRVPPESEAPTYRGSELYGWTERQMGDFTPGRWGWVLEHIRPVEPPFPYPGARGLFEISMEELELEE